MRGQKSDLNERENPQLKDYYFAHLKRNRNPPQISIMHKFSGVAEAGLALGGSLVLAGRARGMSPGLTG